MGVLREKMIEEMKLRNFSARTQQSYVAAMGNPEIRGHNTYFRKTSPRRAVRTHPWAPRSRHSVTDPLGNTTNRFIDSASRLAE